MKEWLFKVVYIPTLQFIIRRIPTDVCIVKRNISKSFGCPMELLGYWLLQHILVHIETKHTKIFIITMTVCQVVAVCQVSAQAVKP